jgi:hypothetical protein
MCRALDPLLAGVRQSAHREVRQITAAIVEDRPIGIIPGMCGTVVILSLMTTFA